MSRTALQCFQRNKHSINMMAMKLRSQLNANDIPLENLVAEAQNKFVQCFSYYETDRQYLSFFFIVFKNLIKDIKIGDAKWYSKHLSDPSKILKDKKGTSEEIGYVETLNQMAEDFRFINPLKSAEINDLIETILSKLHKNLHKEIFKRIIEGKIDREIGEELLRSTSNISQLRRTVIWPIVKEVLKIPEDKYEKLIDSGRINFKLMNQFFPEDSHEKDVPKDNTESEDHAESF